MDPSRQQAPTTVSNEENDDHEGWKITPAFCLLTYLSTALLLIFVPFLYAQLWTFGHDGYDCYLELLTDSISVTKPSNVSTTNWRVGLVATSPVFGCKFKLHTIKSRLLQGEEVISQSPWVDGFGWGLKFDKRDHSAVTIDFSSVVMKPGVVSGVVWDFRVEIVVAVKTKLGHSYLDVNCRNLPVNFTVDSRGNIVNGLLLGYRRGCDYVYQGYLDPSV